VNFGAQFGMLGDIIPGIALTCLLPITNSLTGSNAKG
jgi:hypothetical protein